MFHQYAKICLSRLTGWKSKNIEGFNRWQEVICKCQTIPKMFVTNRTSAVDAVSLYFPSDCGNDDTLPRSCGRLVRSWTNLVSPRLNLESLVLSCPISYVTKGQSHSCNSDSPPCRIQLQLNPYHLSHKWARQICSVCSIQTRLLQSGSEI